MTSFHTDSPIKKMDKYFRYAVPAALVILLMSLLLFQSCDKDDPKPVNEEEVITTVSITLVPRAGGTPVNLKFFDADGEHGSIAPIISVSGHLRAATTYDAVSELLNETVDPAADISEEVEEEANDHLFCFDINGDIAIEYADEDENKLHIGLITTWTTGAAGAAEVTVSLRHQAGTKTGECPGTGETDVQVTFNLVVE